MLLTQETPGEKEKAESGVRRSRKKEHAKREKRGKEQNGEICATAGTFTHKMEGNCLPRDDHTSRRTMGR